MSPNIETPNIADDKDSDHEPESLSEEPPADQVEKDQEEPETFVSPFGVETVDPIVFHRGDSVAPELRAGAFKIPQFRLSDQKASPPPPKPTRRSYSEWIPGGHSARRQEADNGENAPSQLRHILRIVASFLVIAIPFGLILLAVKLVMGMYH